MPQAAINTIYFLVLRLEDVTTGSFRRGLRYLPVADSLFSATSSGVPVAIT